MAALDEHVRRADGLPAAAATAARRHLTDLPALLDGERYPTGVEPAPERVLTVELLKVVGAMVADDTDTVTAPADTGTLLAAARTDWATALHQQVSHEHYGPARRILGMAQAGALPGLDQPLPARTAERLALAEQRSMSTLADLHRDLRDRIDRARQKQEVSEERYDELSRRLAAADPEIRADLATVRAELGEAERLLTGERTAAAARLRVRLDALVSHRSQASVDVDRIRRLIDEGDLFGAEETIYWGELGEPVPTRRPLPDLRPFLAVPDGLTAGVTDQVVHAARSGGEVAGCPVLNFADLTDEDRATAADALALWRAAGAAPADLRAPAAVREHVLPALRLIGYQSSVETQVRPLELAAGPQRRFVDVAGLGCNGDPLVPQFGSSLGGRLRVLLCWGQPDVTRLLTWVDESPAGDPVLVAYFGTMRLTARLRLASELTSRFVDRRPTPVVVLDDAAIAYLASRGNRQLAPAMAILLPFSAMQPYVREKRSLVAPEVFQEREAEQRAVIAPERTPVIFGGRGLGKSALLRSAKAAFERDTGRIAVYRELVGIGPGQQGADAVWDVLLDELELVDVVARGTGRRDEDHLQAVRTGIREWLTVDRERRLLILLDEADGFFEADAPHFAQTSRLRELSQLAGVEGLVKVVFAGLHSVQRFARLPNSVFAQQAATAIGPLRPRSAYDLIDRPTAALGFRFDSDDLILRILGHCAYQPFLLQKFSYRLVERMYRTRQAGPSSAAPPLIITRVDVDAVESDRGLRDEIRSTFRDTLELDHRYDIIANVLADHAHQEGPDARMSTRRLREQCETWWQVGFVGMAWEEFRSLLEEMVGFGLLATDADHRGWGLRSATVLRMIGTQDQVIWQLQDAEQEAEKPRSAQLMARQRMPDGGAAPLTNAQVTDLLGEDDRVRVVIGTAATGVQDVLPALREIWKQLGDRFERVVTAQPDSFREALEGAQPGRRRLVLRDLANEAADHDECIASLTAALHVRPRTPGGQRSVALVSGAGQTRFWQEVLTDDEQPRLGAVVLQRYDPASLRLWAVETGRFAERQEQLLTATGGWPVLVDRATALAARLDSEERALTALSQHLDRQGEAGRFLEAVGLTTDRMLPPVFAKVYEFASTGPLDRDDLVTAAAEAGHPDPVGTTAVLQALGVLDRDGHAATYLVEPVVARCWRRARG